MTVYDFSCPTDKIGAYPMVQKAKNPPAMQGTQEMWV